ncbi:hypothetical protein E8E15_007780 [Penicillium rubens]|nr:hypothetical protein E8E15_007780 [Penicillium rubens]
MGIEDLMNKRIQYHYTEGVDWSYEMWYRSPDRLSREPMGRCGAPEQSTWHRARRN